MQATPPTTARAEPGKGAGIQSMRSEEFRPRRAIWPGLLAAALIGGGVAAVVVSGNYDDRSVGARVDATVAAAGTTAQQGVEALRGAASGAAEGTAKAADRVADSIGDAAITAAVKTALAADPKLSALDINVSTTQGAVRLDGPAPDTKSRQRAETLAMAPNGVVGVDNRLVVAAKPAAAPATRAAPAAPPPLAVAPSATRARRPASPAEAATPIEIPAPADPVPAAVAPASPGTLTDQ